MGTFGKVLLGLNLLALGGFVYLGAQDWKGRLTVEAAGLRHVLVRDGLPLGDRPKSDTYPGDPDKMPAEDDAEIPFVVEMGGGVPTSTVSPAFLKAYFAQAGGGAAAEGGLTLAGTVPVPNQLAEVRRAQQQVKAAVDAADGAGRKAALLRPILERLAETLDERLEVLALGGDGVKMDERLTAKFDQVLKPTALPDVGGLSAEGDGPAPPADADAAARRAYQERLQQRLAKAAEVRGAAVKDAPERRARLAHLLVHLDTDPAWQKRVAMVVGVRRYAQAVSAQAARLGGMAARVARLTADDQDRFSAVYDQLRGLAIQRTQTVRDTADNRARLALQVTKDEGFNRQRESDIADLKAQLERVKGEVNDLLARQKVVEDDLFGVQREVGLTLDEIYRLADELGKKERARYGAK